MLDSHHGDGLAWNAALDLIESGEHLTGGEGIFFLGNKGCGKTTALVALGFDAAKHRRIPWYVAATRFGRIVKAGPGDTPNLQTLEQCGLLMIDELHRVKGLPDWIKTPLMGVIDYRYGEGLQTVAAGTLPLSEMAEVLGDEILDRFKIKISSLEESYR